MTYEQIWMISVVICLPLYVVSTILKGDDVNVGDFISMFIASLVPILNIFVALLVVGISINTDKVLFKGRGK